MAENRKLLMEMLLRMLQIRHFEDRVVKLQSAGEIVGWVHPYAGEEAVAVGVCMALQSKDYIVISSSCQSLCCCKC